MPDIDFVQVLIVFLILLISLTVHEAAHAYTAYQLGDATARNLGRVSLNPAVHIDPIGTILFPLIALMTNLPVLGWAKPVPVDIRNLRGNWKQKYMAVAAAGPASNIVLAIVASVLRSAMDPVSLSAEMLRITIVLNILLAVFNMIPVPPLDGGNVLSGLLRGQAAEAFDRLRPYGFLILYLLMFSGVLTRIIDPPRYFLTSFLL